MLDAKENRNMNSIEKNKIINVICPICKFKKGIDIPKSKMNQSPQLTTISIPKGAICKHHFQIFVDNNFKVRGYQRVDFEFKTVKSDKKELKKETFRDMNKKDDELFENLLLEGNYLEYRPKKIQKNIKCNQKNEELTSKQKEMTLEEIYEEFWEFIDDDNEKFIEFIANDKRR